MYDGESGPKHGESKPLKPRRKFRNMFATYNIRMISVKATMDSNPSSIRLVVCYNDPRLYYVCAPVFPRFTWQA